MQTLAWPSKAAYENRLLGSHDFSVKVYVLDFNERVQGEVTFIDGQIDIQSGQPSRRTASLVVSDPDGALDFSNAAAWSGTSVWVNRLICVQHTITVDGQQVSAIPFIGPPTSLARDGGQVTIAASDKAALAQYGSKPYTLPQGYNAVDAIYWLMVERTGEFRFTFPWGNTRRLSKNYSVGWDDSASPWAVAASIAQNELGMQLLYSCDGRLLLRKMPAQSSSVMTLTAVTEQASNTADFTAFKNYVRATGKLQTNKAGNSRTQPYATATSSNLSPGALARNGVPIYRPMSISSDSWTTQAQVSDHAASTLANNDQVSADLQYSTIPVFHLDADDMVTVRTDDDTFKVRLQSGSIPLGVGGDMTIGWTRKVSAQSVAKRHVSTLRWKKVTTGHKAYTTGKGKHKHHHKSTLKSHWVRTN